MAGIQLSGLVSGLDTQSIISQLMAVESQPRVVLQKKQIVEQARSAALTDISSKLSAMKLAAATLRSASTWANTQTVESADPTKVAVRTIAGAGPGGHTIAVTTLARAAQSTFDYTPPAAADTITVNGQAISLSAGATLDDAVAAINASDTAGVFAVNVGGRLALSSRTTGAASAATATGTMVANGTTLAGADSAFTVDGVAYTRSSNIVSDAIAGVELTLKGQTTGTSLTVSAPGASPDAVVSAVQGFVTAYNAVIDAVRSRTTEKSVPAATTSADLAKGSLFNDSGLNSVLSSLRSAMSGPVAGLMPGMDQLSEIGISTGATTGSGSPSQDAVAGKLTVDVAALRAKLDSDPQSVKKLLGGTPGVNGATQVIEGVLTPLTQAGGTFAGRIDSSASTLKDITDTLAKFDDRLSQHQDYLQKQFTALEVAMQQNQATLAQVTAQLG